jgi:poly-D-alanine transfer protein DltD
LENFSLASARERFPIIKEIPEDGFKPFQEVNEFPISEKKTQAEAFSIHSQMKPQFTDLNIKAMTKLLEKAKERNVQVVFVITPIHKEFQPYLPQEKIEKEVQLLGRFSKKSGSLVLDYRTSSLFTQEDFIDHIHLGKRGAQKLSRQVNFELKKRN